MTNLIKSLKMKGVGRSDALPTPKNKPCNSVGFEFLITIIIAILFSAVSLFIVWLWAVTG